MMTTITYSVSGLLTAEVKLQKDLEGTIYLDGHKCYWDAWGNLFICSPKQMATNYSLVKARGIPLQPLEHLFFKDFNPVNVRPENLEILKRNPKESIARFSARMKAFKKQRYYRNYSVQQLISNFKQRESEAWGLDFLFQLTRAQGLIDDYWRDHWQEAPGPRTLWRAIEKVRKLICVDVRFTDLILTEPPKSIWLKMHRAGLLQCQYQRSHGSTC